MRDAIFVKINCDLYYMIIVVNAMEMVIKYKNLIKIYNEFI